MLLSCSMALTCLNIIKCFIEGNSIVTVRTVLNLIDYIFGILLWLYVCFIYLFNLSLTV